MASLLFDSICNRWFFLFQQDDVKTLNSICDNFLADVLKLLKVETVVAVGKFAEKRTEEVVKAFGLKNVKVSFSYFCVSYL